jgi:replicative DNA helicase
MATEPKKVKRTDFMKLSSTLRTNRTFTNKQFKEIAVTSIKRIVDGDDDDKLLNEIAEQALRRIDDIKQSLITKQKAIIAQAQKKIEELEGKKSQ